MHVIFDMDGVLFDTEGHVRESYRHAGVDMPEDAWSLPWRQWLPDLVGSSEEAAKVHRRKNEIYLKMIAQSPPENLVPYSVMLDLKASNVAQVGILTGASREATMALLRSTGTVGIDVIGCGMSREGKIDALHGLAPRGIYVDDRPFAVTNWRIVGYNGDETRTEILDKMWMP